MSEVQERDKLMSRILSTIKNELDKSENRQHIKCFLDPVMMFFIKTIQPYIVLITILLLVLIISQTYVAYTLVCRIDALR